MSKPFHLKNGTILLSTEAPGGLYNAAQLKKIAAISDANMAIVKATEDQRLALFVKEADASKIAAELKSIGLGIRHYQDGLHQPTACIGELCPDHEQDALGAAMDLTKELADIKCATALKIGLNGCAACCVPCHTLDISILGDAHGYRISLGGKNSQLPEMASFMAEGVPAAKLSALVKNIVMLYEQNAQEGENLQAVMERVGAGSFITALAPYSQDAAAGSDDLFGAAEAPAAEDETLASAAEDSLEREELGDLGEESLGALEPAALVDEGLEDFSPEANLDADVDLAMDAALDGDTNLTMEADFESNADLDDIQDLDTTATQEETSDLDLIRNSTEDLELLAQSDGDTLLKDDLSIGGGDEFGELEDDISTVEDIVHEVDEIPFTDDDLLMEDPVPAALVPAPTPTPMIEEDEIVEEAGDDFETQLEESIAEEENIRAMEEPDDILQARDEALDILEEQISQDIAEEASPTMLSSAAPPKKAAPGKRSGSAPSRPRQDLCGLSMDEQGHLILEFEGGATVALDPARFNDGEKTLKISGQTIHIIANAEGYHVEADGMTFFQPLDGLAAA